MGSPFDEMPRLRGARAPDAGLPTGAEVFNFPRLRETGGGSSPRRPTKSPSAASPRSNDGGVETSAETEVFSGMPRTHAPSDAPQEMGPPAPPEEPAWYETLLDHGAAVAQGVTQNFGDEIADFASPGSGQILRDAAERHPISHGVGQAAVGVGAALAAAPTIGAATAGSPLFGSMMNRGAQALLQGGLSAASEYGDSHEGGKALGSGILGTLAGYGGAMFGEAAAGLGSAARGLLRGAPKPANAALEAELAAAARAEPTPRIPRPAPPEPAPTPPPLGPPPTATPDVVPPPRPAGVPPETPEQSLRSTFANEFDAVPPERPDLRAAFPDELPPETPVNDAWTQELVTPEPQPPRPGPTELATGPVPRARAEGGQMRAVPPQERALRRDGPLPEPTEPPVPLDIAEPPPSSADPLDSLLYARERGAQPLTSDVPPPPMELEPVTGQGRMRMGDNFSLAPPPNAPPPAQEPGLLWKGARALTYAGGRTGAAMRAGMDALYPAVGQPLSPGARKLGGALGEAAWEVGAPAVFDRKVNAQAAREGDAPIAYAGPATTNYALTAVLSSGASGLSQQDEQTLTGAVMSGDDAKIRAADFRLRLANPAYARAVERELRSYQDGEGY